MADVQPGGDRDILRGQPVSRLDQEMKRELTRWSRATRNYGVTYYTSRMILIVASVVVAADQNLRDGNVVGLVKWVPVLSLVVAILAAFDTWLKPQEKWRGFMESRDKLSSLLVLAEGGADRLEIQTRFDALRTEHRQKNVF